MSFDTHADYIPDVAIPLLVQAPDETITAAYSVGDGSCSAIRIPNGDRECFDRSFDSAAHLDHVAVVTIEGVSYEMPFAAVRRLTALLNHPDVQYLLDTSIDDVVLHDARIQHDPRIQRAHARIAAGLPAFPTAAEEHPYWQENAAEYRRIIADMPASGA